jgi:hypothetical protein
LLSNSAKLFLVLCRKRTSNAINNVSLQIFLDLFAMDDAHASANFSLFVRGFLATLPLRDVEGKRPLDFRQIPSTAANRFFHFS